MGRGRLRVGRGGNPCSSWVHISTHQSFLHCTLSPAIHFNGSNGTAYNRTSNSPKQLQPEKLKTKDSSLYKTSHFAERRWSAGDWVTEDSSLEQKKIVFCRAKIACQGLSWTRIVATSKNRVLRSIVGYVIDESEGCVLCTYIRV